MMIPVDARSCNTACGLFAMSVAFFVLLLGLNHFDPRPATGWLLTLVGVAGLCALGVWTWLTLQIATRRLP